MKRIIKNNLVLIIVLGASLVVTIGLLVWTTMDYIQMSRYISQTERLRSDIATLIKKKPAPVEGNVPLVETDMKLYSGAADRLRRMFGHPFEPAVDAFISTLRQNDGEKITLAKFKEDFLAEWNKSERTAQKYSDYKSFQSRFRNWPDAMKAFRAKMEKATVEPLTENNIDEVLLSAIGVPRRFDGKAEHLQRYMAEFRRRLLEITRNKVQFDYPEAANFSFDITGAGYKPEDYPMIAQNWEILGDIVKRATQSGIRSFVSFRHRSIQPEKVGGFDVFHYSVEVTGTMESIRKFVTLLDQAPQDSRVYVVRSIFFYQDDDEAKALLEPPRILPLSPLDLRHPAAETPGLPRNNNSRRRNPSGFRPEGEGDTAALAAAREEAARKAREEEEKNLPYDRRSGYGKILIGQSDLCRAIIDVEYVMESGGTQ